MQILYVTENTLNTHGSLLASAIQAEASKRLIKALSTNDGTLQCIFKPLMQRNGK